MKNSSYIYGVEIIRYMSFYKNIGEIKEYTPGEYIPIGERRIVDVKHIIETHKENYVTPFPGKEDVTEFVATDPLDLVGLSACEKCVFFIKDPEMCWITQFCNNPNCYDRRVKFKDSHADTVIFKKVDF